LLLLLLLLAAPAPEQAEAGAGGRPLAFLQHLGGRRALCGSTTTDIGRRRFDGGVRSVRLW